MGKSLKHLLILLCLAPLTGAALAQSQAEFQSRDVNRPALPRLAASLLDVQPPSARVSGDPGQLRIINRSCQSRPLGGLRQRIVNTATQEWAFFGFSVEDQTLSEPASPTGRVVRRPWPSMSVSEATRVAHSIAGYWAAAPDTDWLLQRQNERWNREGITARWRDAWSAVFISWVICESGVADTEQFQRAIAHHSYIDQAIRARDGQAPGALYIAREPGSAPVVPGDLLCRGSRPVYETIDQRRQQLGEGARTHCDIVVKVDEQAREILTIGGNVRGSVRLKRLPAETSATGHLFAPQDRGRPLFAHLALRADSIDGDAMDHSPTLLALACSPAAPAGSAIEIPVSGARRC